MHCDPNYAKDEKVITENMRHSWQLGYCPIFTAGTWGTVLYSQLTPGVLLCIHS